MVRAKFRCMSVSHAWNKQFTVDLQPVTSGKDEENKSFWRATPSGEIRLVYNGDTPPFVVGEYYFVDMEEGDKSSRWRLYELRQTESQLGITLSVPWDNALPLVSGSVKMGIDNVDVWAPFLGKVGAGWSVTFTEV